MFWIVAPRSKRHLVWKIVAYRQVHISSPRAGIATDDDVMSPWERQPANRLRERFHLLIRNTRLQADHQNVTKHIPKVSRSSRRGYAVPPGPYVVSVKVPVLDLPGRWSMAVGISSWRLLISTSSEPDSAGLLTRGNRCPRMFGAHRPNG